jgi:hypothetical protein
MKEIKDVFERMLIDPAPPLAGSEELLMTVRRAENRRRAAIASAGAGLAVVLVAGGVAIAPTVFNGGGSSAFPGASPEATAPAVPTPSAALSPSRSPGLLMRDMILGYGPTWLPAGLVERGRMGFWDDGGGWIRQWAGSAVDVSGGLPAARLELAASPIVEGSFEDTGQVGDGQTAVDIGGGKQAILSRKEGMSTLQWRADARTALTLYDRLGLSQADLLRVARSVQADESVFSIPLRLATVPEGREPSMIEFVGNSPTSYLAKVHLRESTAPTESKTIVPSTISIAVGTVTTAPNGGEPLTVAGRPARLIAGTQPMGSQTVSTVAIAVDLGAGKWLTISGREITREQAIAVAEQVQVIADADRSWIGR